MLVSSVRMAAAALGEGVLAGDTIDPVEVAVAQMMHPCVRASGWLFGGWLVCMLVAPRWRR